MKTMQLLKIGLLFSVQVNYVDGAGMRSRNMQQIVYTEQDEVEMNQHRSDTSTVKELHLQTVSDANAIGGSRRQLSFWSSFMSEYYIKKLYTTKRGSSHSFFRSCQLVFSS